MKDKICLRALEKITSRLRSDERRNPKTQDTTLQALDENAGGQCTEAYSQNMVITVAELLHLCECFNFFFFFFSQIVQMLKISTPKGLGEV